MYITQRKIIHAYIYKDALQFIVFQRKCCSIGFGRLVVETSGNERKNTTNILLSMNHHCCRPHTHILYEEISYAMKRIEQQTHTHTLKKRRRKKEREKFNEGNQISLVWSILRVCAEQDINQSSRNDYNHRCQSCLVFYRISSLLLAWILLILESHSYRCSDLPNN